MKPAVCSVCGGPLDRMARCIQEETGPVRSWMWSCPACGALDELAEPLPLPPPWRDAQLAAEGRGLLVGRAPPAALAAALRRAAGLRPALAAARAARAPGLVLVGLPAEVDALVSALRGYGLPARALPAAPEAAPDLLLRHGGGAPPPPAPPRLAAALRRAVAEAGGAADRPPLSWPATTAPSRALRAAPRLLWAADGRILDAAGPIHEGEPGLDQLFDRQRRPPPLGACIEALTGPAAGLWPLGPAACVGLRPARILEALWSAEAQPAPPPTDTQTSETTP
ncbi:MAG: hypothetical protein JNM72_02965 [Deltaproteobacteria bacterium]|nr:hypothetical protein [Deltaproteobacteria bacterium]